MSNHLDHTCGNHGANCPRRRRHLPGRFLDSIPCKFPLSVAALFLAAFALWCHTDPLEGSLWWSAYQIRPNEAHIDTTMSRAKVGLMRGMRDLEFDEPVEVVVILRRAER